MIALIMPFMRKEQGMRVLQDLNRQVLKPDLVHVVMQGAQNRPSFFKDFEPKFKMWVSINRVNQGTNAVWNGMWDKPHQDKKYIGVIGDDYRLNPYCLARMVHVLDTSQPSIYAATCHILQKREMPPVPDGMRIMLSPCPSKGHMGFCLFNRDFLVQHVPPIPAPFKIFFGDDWIGWHLDKAGTSMYQLVDTHITHFHHEDLGGVLKYKEVIKKERATWKSYIRGQIEL